MNARSVVRGVLCACAVLLLVVISWWAVTGGLRNLSQSKTIAQIAESTVQLGCGVLSTATAITRFRWRAFAPLVRMTWLVTLVLTVGLSALVWGPPMLDVALLFAVVAFLAAWTITWALGPATAA